MKASILDELLRLDIEGRAFLDRTETLDLQGRACLLDSLKPGSDTAGKPLLGQSTLLLAYDLAPLVLDQVGLRQAAHGLLLVPAQNHSLGHPTLGNLAHGLLLHGLHGLHG